MKLKKISTTNYYFFVDADAAEGYEDMLIYNPGPTRRVLRTWHDSQDQLAAVCWMDEFVSVEEVS